METTITAAPIFQANGSTITIGQAQWEFDLKVFGRKRAIANAKKAIALELRLMGESVSSSDVRLK